MAEKPTYSDQTVLLIGIAAMLLVAVLYVWLDIEPDLPPSE
jgi:hypothetical protein